MQPLTGFMLYCARNVAASNAFDVSENACRARGSRLLAAWRRLSSDAKLRFDNDAACLVGPLQRSEALLAAETEAARLQRDTVRRKCYKSGGLIPVLPQASSNNSQ